MTIEFLTLFPQMFTGVLTESILGRASKNGNIKFNVIDIREYSKDSHSKCDDYPFGGGAGMVMTAQPIYDAINSIDPDHKARRIYLSPRGSVFSTTIAKRLATVERLIFLCGRYEGIDQRVIDMCIDEEICIGDYILTGGELASMVVTDAVSRYVDGVLGNSFSAVDESFSNNLLEYPQYTRPENFMGNIVPEVLLSGHHKNIDKWRAEQSLAITKQRRPDLLKDKND